MLDLRGADLSNALILGTDFREVKHLTPKQFAPPYFFPTVLGSSDQISKMPGLIPTATVAEFLDFFVYATQPIFPP